MRYIIFLFFTCISAYADIKDPYVLAATEGDPTPNLCPYVNSLTGDFLISEPDLIINAAEPLILRRAYVSGDGHGGWSFFPHTTLLLYNGGSRKKKYIRVAEPSGSSIIYKSSTKNTHTYKLAFEKQGKGATNTTHGIISGRTNLRNTVLHRDDETITMSCANGTLRTYKESERRIYLLHSEKLSNGNYILYQYDKKDRLKKISTTNPSKTKTYAYAKISYPSSHSQSFEITTSDGKKLSYSMAIGSLLKKTSSYSPEEKFNYKAAQDSGMLVKERIFPDGRKIQADYYSKKDSGVKSQEDPRCDRIKTIYEMVGEELVPTYRFSYDIEREKNKKGKKHFTYKENGRTDIRDALNNLTRVHFTPDFYVTDIERFEKETFHSKVHFEWGAFGQLKSKSLFDNTEKKIWERILEYDPYGNVKKEIFSGNLSGADAWESYTKTYTYDTNNRMLSQEEDNGKKTTYTYLNDTNLLTTCLIFDQDKILKREFRTYNTDNLLETLITDDGDTEDSNIFSNVIERFITKFRYEEHGLTEWIEEYYLEGAQELLLKKTHLVYNIEGKLKQKDVYNSHGHLCYILSYDYDAYGYLIYETNPLGEETKATYDDFGNQLTYQAPGKPFQEKGYDKGNLLKYSVETANPGNKHHTYYHYNHKRECTDTLDYLNRKTLFEHDLDGNVIAITSPPVGDVRLTTKSTYNCLGKQTSTTTPAGHTTTTEYTSRGNPTLITYPDGAQKRYIYNLDGTLKTFIDEEGYETHYTWDIFERPLTKETAGLAKEIFTYNSFHLLTHTNSEGYTTTYTYDKAGRKKSEAKEEQTLLYFYDGFSRVYCTQQEDLFTFTKYNYLDQLTEEREEDLSGTLLSKITYIYHPSGNLKEICRHHDDGISIETTNYDLWNRIKEKKDPLGHTTTYDYKEDVHHHTLTTTETNPLGHKTITILDSLDRIISIEKKNSSNIRTSLDKFFYNKESQLESQKTKLLSSNTNHGTLNTKWKYDNRGHLVKLVQAHDTPHQKTTRYSYTPRGGRKTITKPDSVILSYTYDPLNRLETITSSACDINYLYHYGTNAAQPTSVDDLISNTTTILSYDPFGNVLQETLANGLTLTNTYDTRSRRKSLTLPDHSLITYDYTANHLYSVSKYTPNEQLAYTHTYTHYDKSGPLRSIELIGNLGTTHYSIDPLARTTALASPYFNQTINKIDPCGNIINMQTDGELLTFSYDSLNQLTEEKDHTYIADSLHRRLEKDNISQDPNILNQLDSFYIHDKNGNPTFCYADGAEYKYDSLERLIEITKQDLRLTFTYDPFHRRLSKTTYIDNTATTLLFLYDGQNEIGAAAPDGILAELRILGHSRGAEISAAIAIELNGQLYAPIHDLFGNLTHLIDTTGTIAFHQKYTSFGEPLNTTLSPWDYSSKRTDSETNLVYFGRRYYDPTHGRWLTPDPSELTDGLNLYQYLFNNPLTSHDLYGLSAEEMHPRFHGSMQALTGFMEASSGASLTYITAGIAAPAGFLIMAHGLDQFITGASTAITGKYRSTMTSQLLQQWGMSLGLADTFDNNLSIAATLGASAAITKTAASFFEIAYVSKGSFGIGTFTEILSGIRNIFSKTAPNSSLASTISTIENGIHSTTTNILTRTKIKSYLSSTELFNKNQLISDLKSIGLKIKGQSPDGRFINFQDRFGNIRVKIHPPDKITHYNHLHIYNKSGNSLNKHLEIVEKTSIDAHIPYRGT